MAHYAKINDDNVVERVEVLDDFYEWSDTGELDENRAVATLKNSLGIIPHGRKLPTIIIFVVSLQVLETSMTQV